MNAIIIAAGMGKRMGPLTEALPKSLAIQWNGRTLFDHQIDTLRACGIGEITIVRGYEGEKFVRDDVSYVWNRDFERNNILLSLMCAQKALKGPVLITYSDIWFEQYVVEKTMAAREDIAVTVDQNWKQLYDGRDQHTVDEAEVVTVGKSGIVGEIGKIFGRVPGIVGEFIGMTKLSKTGADIFSEQFDHAKQEHSGKPFERAINFEKSYLTDMFQYMIRNGIKVHPVFIQGGWMEMDTGQDFERFKNRITAQIYNGGRR